MIAPTYRRAQLWAPARSRLETTITAALIAAGCFIGLGLALIDPLVRAPSRRDVTLLRIDRAVATARGCPHRLGDVMEVPLDAWGHAYEYTCTRTHLVIRSAGEDGVFHTHDDVRSER